ncbi:SDR family NAD(P)-dependent oxidoreductase [Saccharothrix xinjiangensis]|uniref:SDR family NAD(P)-dependent oxidoreductase n=1 Tax=Saccharothrix xinjiangensis TaxID=204798 RepID=A0ABV9Y9G8_9PSEU
MTGTPPEAELRAWLARHVADLVDLPEDEVDVDQPLAELGLSSRDAVVLAGALGDLVDAPLPATALYEHPTIARLARHLAGAGVEHAGGGPVTGDDIAVVGVGCRLPGGVTGPEGLWTFLREGGDAVAPAPPDRWPGLPEGTPRFGGFLPDIKGFDAEFFGIAPHEAAHADPQQRLVLEVSWEALHHAGIAPDSLRGTRTGVFVGISSGEHGAAQAADLDRVEPWTATGGALSIAANRLSYLLDLRGPSLAVDTACSSSLVAVHHACRSLRAGESDTAVVAGVNLLLGPAVTVAFHRAGLLAADGRCKPFDAAADGIARAEGCAVAVLKRLADARRDGDRVLAVVRGSGVNSDGRSNGLMAPNPRAQADLLRRVYAEAGVDPTRVDYVEAHGTGTLLGDPIEAGALREVLGGGPGVLLLGSAKANFGHTESAAGLVGLVKAVLAIHHGEIPPSPHFRAPNPHIDFTGLRVVTGPTPWPRRSGRITAGVSSFGFGGTNAHVVLEEPPAPDPVSRPGGPAFLVVAGVSEQRVRRHAEQLADWLEGGRTDAGDLPDLHDVGATLAQRRGREPFAAVVSGADRGSVAAALRALPSGVRRVEARTGAVWVFSGYGSGWAGMGRRLLAAEPVFADAVDELDGLLAPYSVRELLEVPGEGLGAGQVALFGVQVALARLWASRGVRPAAVIGQSVGEVAAAVVAGALSLPDAALVMTTRARLLDVVDGAGGMAAVELAADEVDDPALSVAVHAAPRRCTVSGPADRLAALVGRVEAEGGAARLLPLRTSGHSPAVEPVLGELVDALRDVRGRPGDVPLYGTVLADPRHAPPFTADYWAAHMRRPVRFTQAVSAALADGRTAFLEVSPHPVALAAIAEHAPDLLLVGTLRRDADEVEEFHDNLAELHLHGLVRPRVVVDVPTAPWAHREHWAAPRPRGGGHPLLGQHVELPDGTHAWQADVGVAALPWLADHRVQGTPVLPGAAYVEMALAAGSRAAGGPVGLRDVEFEALLPLTGEVRLSTTLRGGRVEVHAKAEDGWVRHATATVVPGVEGGGPGGGGPESNGPGRNGLEPVALYDRLAEVGMEYGPAFRGVREARAGGGVADCLLRRPDGPDRALRLPPTLLDSCLHALAAAALDLAVDGPCLPVGIGAVRLHGDPRRADRCEAVVAGDATGLTGSVRLRDDAGTLLAEVLDVRVRPVAAALPALEARWERQDLPARGGPRTWLLLGCDPEVRAALVVAGHRVTGDPAEPADGVVFLPGRDGLEQDLVRLSALASGTRRLWVVTREAAVVLDGEPGAPEPAALRGAVRVLAFERPGLRASIVDVDDLAALPRELAADLDDDEVAWRGGDRYAARLARVDAGAPAEVVAGGAYVVTGGLGGLGRVVARWLLDRGAARVVLNGRREPAAGVLEGLGGDVVVVTGDVAEPGVAEDLVAAAVAGGLPLRGVVHAAGVLADAPADRVSPEDVRRVLRPKVDGALRLHEATTGHRLDWFVLFSSAAALLGSPGQLAYAAANAWLDGFARWRRAGGLPATSIGFGAWSRVGLARDTDNPLLRPISPAEGVAAVEALVRSGRAVTGVARFDPRAAVELFPQLARRPFLAGFLQPGDLVAAGGDRLTAIVERVLGAAPDPAAPLTSLGLDSLMAMRLRNAVEHELGARLPVPLLLRGASLQDLARHLDGEAGGDHAGGDHTGGDHAGRDHASGDPAGSAGRPGRRVEPRDPTERWLFGLCARVLGRRDFGVHDDFAALGGSAADLLALVRQRAPGADLGGARTVEAMAEHLRGRFEGADGPVRVLRAGGSLRPLHLFHPAGGPTGVYQPLVDLLPDRPCRGYERVDDVPDIPAKAKRYADLVLAAQPSGPYLLGGWSFGGCLAHEVACRLVGGGHEVELVVMIDTVRPLPAPDVPPAELVRHRFERYLAHVERVHGASVELPWEALSGLDDVAQVDAVLTALVAAGVGISPGALRHQRTSYLDARAAERFTPRRFPGRVVFYRATERETLTTVLDPRYLRRQEDDDLGWADACGSLEVVPVPGDHLSMVDPPHVAVLADHLRRVLGG